MYNVIARVTMTPKLNRTGGIALDRRERDTDGLAETKANLLRTMRSTFAGAMSFSLTGYTGSSLRQSSPPMASLDTVSLSILFGATLVLAGILSSLVALRFGAPLLLVFLILGMLAGELAVVGGICFDDVRLTYLVGSIALALILFYGGLRTRIATFRSVLAPSLVLATLGVLLTAALTAPAVTMVMGYGWTEALLVGAVVASTDAAAVLFLLRARGLRLRSRVAATLEIESGTNDPFAIFLNDLAGRIIAYRRSAMGVGCGEPWRPGAGGRGDRACWRSIDGAGAQPACSSASVCTLRLSPARCWACSALDRRCMHPASSPSILPV